MRTITAADYLMEFLIVNGVTDVFGYQGGMVAHIFDSMGVYRDRVAYHELSTEQGAALAACGWAQTTDRLGVVITTSGPGFTNALTGLANAWFDSVPFMLISGQVNTKDKRRGYTFRQHGFQEIQSPAMAAPIVKKTYEIDADTDIPLLLDDAYRTAMRGRKGPVFLDFPIDVERKAVEVADECPVPVSTEESEPIDTTPYVERLLAAKRPLIIAGAGISQAGVRDEFRELVEILGVPVVTTMSGVDIVPSDSPCHVGYLGGTARRESGVVLRHADFVFALGSRLCNKAIGYNHDDFIPEAKSFIRVDVDAAEFERQLKGCEEVVLADLRAFVPDALGRARKLAGSYDHSAWSQAVRGVCDTLAPIDVTFGNEFVAALTAMLPAESSITLDVGNNLVYGVQSSVVKDDTRVHLSAGLGAMGYSLPAAIGASIANGRITCAIMGDGGAQMNIQELNYIAKEHLPIKVVVLNNRALAHIILFQEHYLDGRLVATTEHGGDYHSCNFAALAVAYGMRSVKVRDASELIRYKEMLLDSEPLLIEVEMELGTVLPNIHGGLDPLTNGPKLSQDVVDRVKELIN